MNNSNVKSDKVFCGECKHFALTTPDLETGWCLFIPDLSCVSESMVNTVKAVIGSTYRWREATSCDQFTSRLPEDNEDNVIPLDNLLFNVYTA